MLATDISGAAWSLVSEWLDDHRLFAVPESPIPAIVLVLAVLVGVISVFWLLGSALNRMLFPRCRRGFVALRYMWRETRQEVADAFAVGSPFVGCKLKRHAVVAAVLLGWRPSGAPAPHG
jgi:hypothetical protein